MNTHPLPIQVAPVSPRLVAVLFLAATFCATAQTTNELQATVTPGFIWSSSTRLTAQNLNRAANPTVEITGTVPGSALGTNTIGKQHIQTNVFDQAYLSGGNNSSASIIAGSLDYTLMATNAVYGTNIQDASIEGGDIATNTITASNLKTNLMSALAAATPATNDLVWLADTSAASNSVQATIIAVQQTGWFVSSEITLASSGGMATNVAHSLGRTPYIVRAVLVCKTNDLGWVAGTEINLDGVSRNNNNERWATGATIGSDSTNVYVAIDSTDSTTIQNYTTQEIAIITPAHWKLKAYAW